MIVFRLSEILEDLHISQKELAEMTGIRPATINEIYHGQTKRFNVGNLDKICKALDCTTEDVLEYIPDEDYKEFFNRLLSK